MVAYWLEDTGAGDVHIWDVAETLLARLYQLLQILPIGHITFLEYLRIT
jgi:hypothetical protein